MACPVAPRVARWAPGAWSSVLPFVLRLNETDWQFLNLGYERIPAPGWPPNLS